MSEELILRLLENLREESKEINKAQTEIKVTLGKQHERLKALEQAQASNTDQDKKATDEIKAELAEAVREVGADIADLDKRLTEIETVGTVKEKAGEKKAAWIKWAIGTLIAIAAIAVSTLLTLLLKG